MKTLKYCDLFCGIGGFRYAAEAAARACNTQLECVFSSDIDAECRKAYFANFNETPAGDIRRVGPNSIPEHDLLLAGFPCQPFSICGEMKGFNDTRGTLFFEIAKILELKRPRAFVLENVKLLQGHNGGRTLTRILQSLRGLGYHVDHTVLNALDFGLPQKRERIFIVGTLESCFFRFPEGGVPMTPLSKVLEDNVAEKHYASERIRNNRRTRLKPLSRPTIWHENKAGHVSAYPYSCALRAGASYNYLLVDGERRLTPREMLRLQGFPDSFKIVCNDSQTRKQAGNSVPVPVVQAVLEALLDALRWSDRAPRYSGSEIELFPAVL